MYPMTLFIDLLRVTADRIKYRQGNARCPQGNDRYKVVKPALRITRCIWCRAVVIIALPIVRVRAFCI
jgi:hypothetical protein